MVIVAGQLHVAAADRGRFLARSREAVQAARATAGCHDYVVAADPLDAERINVYERWADRASLDRFRGDGPGDDLSAMILGARVDEFEVLPASDG